MRRTILAVLISFSLLVGCRADEPHDFSNWDEERVYRFLNEIDSHISDIPLETDNKEEIVQMYEAYFSPELSVKIVDSLYQPADRGWKVPDGDSGYIFFVPDNQQNKVTMDIGQDAITVQEEFEFWMHARNQYTITYDQKPIISEWIME